MSPSERQDTRKTTFRTASDLRRLIEVASFDNVQPQAILAAQALGRRLQVSPALKRRAILALNRRDSVRWDNLNLTIGLNDSPFIEMIQNSDPLLAFFLFVCAWKPCFTDSEVADLAFEMMELSEILDKFPVVASSQLCELIKVFSGHCEDLAPIDIMYRLAIEVHERSLDADNLYMGLTSWSLADALLQLFELLGDDSVGSITLSGCTGGILLVTAFLWLNPEATSVSIDGELLNGHDGNSKLRFAFKTRPADFSDYGKWTIEKGNVELSTLEVEAKSDEPIDCFTYIPIKFTRLFLSPSFLVYLKFPIRSRAIQTVGEVAGALIVLLTEFGSIYAPQPCCEESETECTKTFLRDLFHHNWMTRYSSAIQEYGWTESTVNGQDMAVALLQSVFAKLLAQAADEEQFWKDIEEAGGHYIQSRLGADPTDYEEEDDEEVATNTIFQTASYIAFHAILTATCLLVSGTRRISLPLYSVGHSCRSLLSPSGISISNFCKYALAQILPGNFSFDFDDIVALSNGYVAGISSFWQVSMQKRDALTLRVVLGS
ncbi:hypothetical protein VTN00DRAFT_859 [Thermoascus crustaceus]|uniref:uncharacterized protein n=1 Tax=Thermoascus crustaceus TaxID=5088 RepID=UPI0037422B3D